MKNKTNVIQPSLINNYNIWVNQLRPFYSLAKDYIKRLKIHFISIKRKLKLTSDKEEKKSYYILEKK